MLSFRFRRYKEIDSKPIPKFDRLRT